MSRGKKLCRKCGVERPMGDFYSDPKKKDGKHTVCRICKTKSKGALRRGPDPTIPKNTLRCQECSQIKPIGDYHKATGKGRYGVRQPCKQCRTKTNRSRDNAPRFRVIEGVEEARCTKCNKWLPLEQFTLLARNGMRSSHCKPCKVAYTKKWTASNRDKVVGWRLSRQAQISETGSFTNSVADRTQLLLAIAKRYNGYLHSDRKRLRKRLERRIHGLSRHEVKERLLSVERSHKVSIDAFLDFVLSKKPFCECCNRELDMSVDSTDFAIDHFHDTGRLRGLLCNDCNLGIGSFHDSITVLKAAKRYLDSHHAKRDVSKVR